jgi:hypothetical protein
MKMFEGCKSHPQINLLLSRKLSIPVNSMISFIWIFNFPARLMPLTEISLKKDAGILCSSGLFADFIPIRLFLIDSFEFSLD